MDLIRIFPGCEGEFLQNIQCDECDDALTVGWKLADIITAVVDAKRFYPDRLMSSQILIAQETAELTAFFVDLSGQITGIEGGGIRFGDLFEGVCMILQIDDLTWLITVVKWSKSIKPTLMAGIRQDLFISFESCFPGLGQIGTAGKALPAIANGRFHDFT